MVFHTEAENLERCMDPATVSFIIKLQLMPQVLAISISGKQLNYLKKFRDTM